MSLWKATGSILVSVVLVQTASGRTESGSTPIAVRDRANAFASLAASNNFAAIAWGATKDGVTDVYTAVSRDGGRTFGAPARVNAAGSPAHVSGEQPPRVALVQRTNQDPAVVVVWTAKSDAGSRLFSARSDDGGKSFAAAVVVPGTEAAGNRGWESIASTRDGSVVAMWLDHRALAASSGASPMNHAEHQHGTTGENKKDGVARAQLSKLFFAKLGAGEGPRPLTGGVCYCCKTSIATDASGGIYAAWRHVYEGNIRDIAFSRSVDGGRTFTTPARVSDDKWVLDGCPENGPALAVDQGKRIHVAWPTLVPGGQASSEPTLGLFYAISQDGVHFTPRQQLPTEGFPRHVQMVVTGQNEIVAVWDEQAPGTRRIAIARGTLNAAGVATFVRRSIDEPAAATYPVIAAADGGLAVAWTSGPSGQTVLRTQWLAK
jgi:hypothetical protein